MLCPAASRGTPEPGCGFSSTARAGRLCQTSQIPEKRLPLEPPRAFQPSFPRARGGPAAEPGTGILLGAPEAAGPSLTRNQHQQPPSAPGEQSFSQGFHPPVPSVTPPGDPELGDAHRKAQGAAKSSGACHKCKPRSGFSPASCNQRRKLPLGHPMGTAQRGDSLHLTGHCHTPKSLTRNPPAVLRN